MGSVETGRKKAVSATRSAANSSLFPSLSALAPQALNLAELMDGSEILGRLKISGLSQRAALRTAENLARAGRLALERNPPSTHCVAHFVPGRIEVLGKHTDYAGGRSLLATIEYGMSVVAVPADSPRLRMSDAARSESVEIVAGSARPDSGWGVYPWSVVDRLSRDLGVFQGADLFFSSDLPAAAGLSSSSVLVTAVLLSIIGLQGPSDSRLPGWFEDRTLLADYLGAIESGRPYGMSREAKGVGTRGGSQDHAAILLSRPGCLVQYGYRPLRFEREIPFPKNFLFAIGVSGVHASKTGEAQGLYNRSVALAENVLELGNAAISGQTDCLAQLLARMGPHQLLDLIQTSDLPDRDRAALAGRLRHFLLESQDLIPSVPSDLEDASNLEVFSKLVSRSHEKGNQWLQNQTPETLFLAEAAERLGARTASAFGAGFGGSVWALVERASLQAFLRDWSAVYRARFPERKESCAFLSSRPGPAAFRL